MIASLLACTLLSVTMSATTSKPKLAVLPLVVNRLGVDVGKALDQLVVGALDQLGKHDVTTAADIEAMLGVERMKDALGCDDISCAAEIGGALGADQLLTSHASLLGDEVLVSFTLIDSRRSRVLARKQTSFVNDEKRYGPAVRIAVYALFGADAPAEKQRETEWLQQQKATAVSDAQKRERLERKVRVMRWTGLGLGIGGVALGGLGLLVFALAPSEGEINQAYQKYLVAPTSADASTAYRLVSRNISRRNTFAGLAIGLGTAGLALLGAGSIVYGLSYTVGVEPTNGGALWSLDGVF